MAGLFEVMPDCRRGVHRFFEFDSRPAHPLKNGPGPIPRERERPSSAQTSSGMFGCVSIRLPAEGPVRFAPVSSV